MIGPHNLKIRTKIMNSCLDLLMLKNRAISMFLLGSLLLMEVVLKRRQPKSGKI